MPRFFLPEVSFDNSIISITGDDALHIAKTLRMRPGETLELSDGQGLDAAAHVETVSPSQVTAVIDSVFPNRTEPHLKVTVYAGFPKSDGASVITQKAVELGASEIVFFLSERTVRRPSDAQSAMTRLNRIAREAAGQSGRGILPAVRGLLSFEEMLSDASKKDIALFCYENGGQPMTAPYETFSTCAIITGPEGGFAPEEALKAQESGLRLTALGPRILRCETAPLCALSAVMYAAGELNDVGHL